jgi:hypothetical protein
MLNQFDSLESSFLMLNLLVSGNLTRSSEWLSALQVVNKNLTALGIEIFESRGSMLLLSVS